MSNGNEGSPTPSGDELNSDDLRLFQERLPWYVNGSLEPTARVWVEACVGESPAAAALLERERALAGAVEALLAPAPEDVGLARVQQMLKAERTAKQARFEKPSLVGLGARLAHGLQALARPQFAGAMLALLVLQFGAIGWLAMERQPTPDDSWRSIPVAEVRTLRVTFVASVTERQIRTALIAAGARIVGGPNQVGEYWLASQIVSIDEMRASLEKSGVTATIETDTIGPR